MSQRSNSNSHRLRGPYRGRQHSLDRNGTFSTLILRKIKGVWLILVVFFLNENKGNIFFHPPTPCFSLKRTQAVGTTHNLAQTLGKPVSFPDPAEPGAEVLAAGPGTWELLSLAGAEGGERRGGRE